MGHRWVAVARVYDEPRNTDGVRVLVDRIWPRGMSKERATLDHWCKTVAPSTELRKWYHHAPDRFEEFATRYETELEEPERAQAVRHLKDLAEGGAVTLLTATKNLELSHAQVLSQLLSH